MLDGSARSESEIAIIGQACRLPGAANVDALWSLLTEARCAITQVPEDRWSHDVFVHPRRGEPGKTYTAAAGILDRIWDFDAAAFGISPREALQMDPQQRLVLELVWEALEDAGIAPSSLAGQEVGVFSGASAQDHGTLKQFDPAAGDAYFAPGNALSLISNRVSYIFDLRGPSYNIDTACSSSLVALNEAVSAIRAGRIDVAIVAGVNALLSPFHFIGFAAASMLSPTGLCRPFGGNADGYVRAEGGVVLVLSSLPRARALGNRIFGVVVHSGVNSDGRTVGVSMPSRVAQSALLEKVYRAAGVDLNQLAFVEAHGTGTRVGDPIEATAIGEAIGRNRTSRLPIGSIKGNIGHLEPASGLAGVLKATLALNHDLLPPSLHSGNPNPDIPFESLNLSVCNRPLALPRGAQRRYAGVNSFGFGGTNAHAIIADAPAVALPAIDKIERPVMVVSAHSRPALEQLAGQFADRLDRCPAEDAHRFIAAAGHRRDRLPHRLAVPADSAGDMATALRAYAEHADAAALVAGTAVERDAPSAFVYSGNGSQWPGMGQAAYRTSKAFQTRFDEVDALFNKLAHWSLREALFAENIENRLALTSVAQPLIFAIQSASTAALTARGLGPAVVLGHSVGEIAAAEAAGALDLEQAVAVIHYRSLHQELTRNCGCMAVLFGSPDEAQKLANRIGGLEIAAYNGPRAVTMSGPAKAIDALAAKAARDGLKLHRLDLDYPFHNTLMNAVKSPLLRDLAVLSPSPSKVPFISTVEGTVLAGERLDGFYWWRNVREPVRFQQAVEEAARHGARVFVEIGPRRTLLSLITDCVEPMAVAFASIGVLDRVDTPDDPFVRAAANAFVRGAKMDMIALAGADAGGAVALPGYPWQRKTLRLGYTTEAIRRVAPDAAHPLAGARLSPDATEWHSHLDTMLVPELRDHQIDGQVILAGAAFLEMAFAVAQQWFGSPAVTVSDLELLQSMPLSDDVTREIKTRISPVSNILEILSRPRLSNVPWQLHAKARIFDLATAVERPVVPASRQGRVTSSETLYALTKAAGLQYGATYQQAAEVRQIDRSTWVVEFIAASASCEYGLDPARLDASFHALVLVHDQDSNASIKTPFVPVRFTEARLLKSGSVPVRAVVEIEDLDRRSLRASFTLLDAEGEVVSKLRDVRFRAVRWRRPASLSSHTMVARLVPMAGMSPSANRPPVATDVLMKKICDALGEPEDGPRSAEELLLEGWATACAVEVMRGLADDRNQIDLESLIEARRLPATARPWAIAVLSALQATGLAEGTGGRWKIVNDESLPHCAAVLNTLMAEHPQRSSELLVASRFTALAERLQRGGNVPTESLLTPAMIDAHDLGGIWKHRAGKVLIGVLEQLEPLWAGNRALHILQVGYGPLSPLIADLTRSRNAHLTILISDGRKFERARHMFGSERHVTVVAAADALAARSVDLMISAGGLYRVADSFSTFADLLSALCHEGSLIALEPVQSLFHDLIHGLDPEWFDQTMIADLAVGPLRSADGWRRALEYAGFANADVRTIDMDGAAAICATARVGQLRKAPDVRPSGVQIVVVANGTNSKHAEIASCFATIAAASGHGITIEFGETRLDDGAKFDHFVYLGAAETAEAPAVEALRNRCLGFKHCIEGFGSRPGKLWVITSGAFSRRPGGPNAVEVGFWAFTRTAANENPNLDIRRVDIAPSLSAEGAAESLKALILSGSQETEIVIDSEQISAVRLEHLGRYNSPDGGLVAPAARLERNSNGGLDHLSWNALERVDPNAGEIEIAVQAIGLNFRDVMLALSLLPDDILENGFAGPTLGLECAGRVVRVGSSVREFKEGDRVIAFSPSAFSSHVTIPEKMAFSIPANIATEAAATIPVAFATAYYAIKVMGQMRRGEWLLVHGGAGGVGLAALQIARRIGARVIATAGSAEKRELLRAIGADYVLDSRTLAFRDQVREITGQGVDVVLNSLSGEAMQHSLALVNPFGRFIELGKRDYVANTQIGLRPFYRNVSYFGVDLDQLLLRGGNAGTKLMRQIMKLFEKGILSALPYRRFSASETVDAFRVMQQSGHIGKIVIAPPIHGAVRKSNAGKFVVDPDRTHVVTGAFGGFGVETVRWLARSGARHLALLGRSGSANSEAAALLTELKSLGINVREFKCDVSNRAVLAHALDTIRAEMPPLAGLIHAAMVLDDGIIENLDPDRFDGVLRPKVAGAENLDELTRHDKLDYFLMFSSITTAIGNPGQGNYVAANGFLEGLARRRRCDGLPALAIAWGAIGDVGVLAKGGKAVQKLMERGGLKPMTARSALELLTEAMARPADTVESSVMFIAPVEWSTAREHLSTLKSPTYSALVQEAGMVNQSALSRIDIAELVATVGADAATQRISELVADEVARVLRLPKEDINLLRPLSEAGVDSLMTIELAMSLQEKFALGSPLPGSASTLTITDLARQIVVLVTEDKPNDESQIELAVAKHLTTSVDAKALSAAIAPTLADRRTLLR